MAAQFVVTTGKVTPTATSTKSLWLLNPVTNEARITQIEISMDASGVASGLEFDLYKVTTLGSPAGTTGTENNLNPTQQAATTTSLTTLTTEPTTKAVFASWYLQPVGGLLVIQFPLGREPVLAQAGARWGLQYITTAGSGTPDIISNVYFEE